ncbi:MAG: PEGA domain-containing protein, partial [bacterium]
MKDRTTFSFRLPIFRPVLIIPLFFVFCSLFLLETIATATIGGTIILETVPPGATVLLDFQEKGKTPLTIKDIPQGKHLLTIDLRHYHRVEKQLQVYAGQTIKQRHVLKHLLGFLNVKTDPPGARVKLIGKNIISKDNEFNKSLSAVFVGITPLFKPNVIIGRYTLEVSLENYQTYRKKFNLAYGQEKNFDIKLKGLPGKLKLTTTPRQARVFINGKIIGKTNFIKELNPGTYLLHIKRAGYLESKMEVVVESQKTTELNLKLHKTDVGEIVVKTVPEGAKVYIDSQRKGNTPLTLKYYAEGEYRISLEKPGYYTIDKMIRVEGGETTLLEEQMERQVATLDVTTEPSGAKILLDNSPIGFSPLTVSRISVGEHVLRARMTGYLDYLKQFYIYEKQYLNIQAKMDPLPGKLRVISSPPGANV